MRCKPFYGVLGACILSAAWVIPGFVVKQAIPRVGAQLGAVIVCAFFLPSSSDPKVPFSRGGFAFGGAVILVGIFHVTAGIVRKLRSS